MQLEVVPFDCGEFVTTDPRRHKFVWLFEDYFKVTKEKKDIENRVTTMIPQSYRVLLKIIYKLALSFLWTTEKKVFDIFFNTEVRLTKDHFGSFELHYLLSYPDNDSSRNNDLFAMTSGTT